MSEYWKFNCELDGGTATRIGGTDRCCTPDWGCTTCSDDMVCVMDCNTDDCCEWYGDCFTIEFPDDVLLEQPDDEPDGRPGRPDLDQPLINVDDSPVVENPEAQEAPVGVGSARLRELVLAMYSPIPPEAFEQGGVIDDTGIDEAEQDDALGDSDGQTGEGGNVNPAEICGAGGGASLMFGLMGLVGMQNRNRRRRTGTAQGGTMRRKY
jgi:hypothetical protein